MILSDSRLVSVLNGPQTMESVLEALCDSVAIYPNRHTRQLRDALHVALLEAVRDYYHR